MRQRFSLVNGSAYLPKGELRISPVGRVPHNILAVAVPNMNPDYAVPDKVLLIDGVNSGLNLRPWFDTLKNLSLGILIATPHQTSVTDYGIRFTIIIHLENLSIWAVNAVDGGLIPPWREEGARN